MTIIKQDSAGAGRIDEKRLRPREALCIKELPPGERPYERLEKHSPSILTDAELLAIVIRTGSRKLTSVELARKVLKIDGKGMGLEFLNDVTLEELRTVPGIGKVKAIQIKAVAELAKRMAACRAGSNMALVKSPEVISRLLMEEMRHLNKEVFKAVLLNAKNYVLRIADISVGSLTASIVHPREVFCEAVRVSSYGIIFVHNHPSGDPEPSREDIETTERLAEAGAILGIKVIDHIIIGNGTYTSMKERGCIS